MQRRVLSAKVIAKKGEHQEEFTIGKGEDSLSLPMDALGGLAGGWQIISGGLAAGRIDAPKLHQISEIYKNISASR